MYFYFMFSGSAGRYQGFSRTSMNLYSWKSTWWRHKIFIFLMEKQWNIRHFGVNAVTSRSRFSIAFSWFSIKYSWNLQKICKMISRSTFDCFKISSHHWVLEHLCFFVSNLWKFRIFKENLVIVVMKLLLHWEAFSIAFNRNPH